MKSVSFVTSARGGVGQSISRVAETAVGLRRTDAASVLADVVQVAADVDSLRLTQLVV